ncbi:MAG: DUF1569 domain-containing protein [Candidatus Hydrogenedens sp.]|jgi:hypothetical protein|nr:DUF1569 domain-containing protein [Candidatus Hydrogenedens sp.]
MDHFDSTYMIRLCDALATLDEDQKPLWGTLTPETLLEHLIWILRQSMGRSLHVPDYSSFLSRKLTKKLILSGMRSLPKNMHLPAHLIRQGIRDRETGDLETLQALMEEYLNLVQADELEPAPHPCYGKMSIDEWDRFHVLHFEHHLKQFGISFRK